MRNFKLKQLPDRTAKPRTNGLTMVMDKGLIIERGTHRQLMEQEGTYHKLYTAVEQNSLN